MKKIKKFRFKGFSSISAKIFISMLALIALMLVFLWLSQTVMLSTFYEYAKKYDTYRVSQSIVENIDNPELSELVTELSHTHDACIKIVNVSKANSTTLDYHNSYHNCMLHKIKMNAELYGSWQDNASENDGFYIEILSGAKFDNYSFNSEKFNGSVPTKDSLKECIISASVATNAKGETILVLYNSSIEPVFSAVNTIRVQLLVITIIMIFAAFIIAYFVAKHMSSPIVAMSNKAKELAKGNYDVSFDEKGTIESVELAKTLNYMVSELSKLDKLQKDLIANISHDLRTPLTMISGYSEVMRDIPGENTPENMQVIIDETARLSSLVNDLLNVSKLQSGTQKMNISKINITDVIKKSIERYEHLISHNGYIVTFDYKHDVYIMADEVRLLQVVYNLINNAINYTGHNKTVRVVQSVKGDVVRVSVIDSGEGISEENLPLIWDRYYKVDKVHTRAKIGTGLGLSIVKNILLLHDSRFGVSSEVGKGSNFWFEFKTAEIIPHTPDYSKFTLDTPPIIKDEPSEENENN